MVNIPIKMQMDLIILINIFDERQRDVRSLVQQDIRYHDNRLMK
jgi:hypothetical protein